MENNNKDGKEISKLKYYSDWIVYGFPKRKGKAKAFVTTYGKKPLMAKIKTFFNRLFNDVYLSVKEKYILEVY